MSVRRTLRLSGAAMLVVFVVCAPTAHAQSQTGDSPSLDTEGAKVAGGPLTDGDVPSPPEYQHEGHSGHAATTDHTAHDMSDMAREGSGTSWLPDASPIYALHTQKSGWMLMLHGNA